MANEKAGFTVRAAIIAVALSLFLLASSSYIAIKIGALPWPIIFSVIVSGGIIKLLSRSQRLNVHEINVAQAGASIGGLIAAGIVFTVPGIIYLNQTRNLDIAWPNPYLLGLLTAVAGLLGILLSVPLKYTFVDEEQLPYPAGTAGAELLKLGQTGGRQLFFILMCGAGAAVFALVRDIYFPAGFALTGLTFLGIYVTILPLPLGISAGYILGKRTGLAWFGGAVIGWLMIIPWLTQRGLAFESTKAIVQNLGMGMVLGAGIGFFVSYIIPRIRRIFAPMLKSRGIYFRLLPLIVFLSLAGLLFIGVPFWAASLAVFGVFIMVAVAARMTGETNIDPLEQFGIFIGLVIAFVYNSAAQELSMFALFMIVTFVSVACAVAGDVGHDYKSAAIIGTKFSDIVKVDIIAVIFAGAAAPFVLETIQSGFADQLFTPAMPAPQAQLVAGSIFGFEYPLMFAAGFALAFLGEISNRFLPEKFKNRVPLMPAGIGLFLGLGLAIPIAVGSLIRAYIDRSRPDLYQSGLLIAAGVMGGEGIAGFSAGALTTAGLNYKTGAFILMSAFVVILLGSLRYLMKNPNKVVD
ncbi:OPT/YSL family transporter [candidate division KSB1 bacterium]|nr:OPT/YSL family transporter [candidate division KSB1 bacterium]